MKSAATWTALTLGALIATEPLAAQDDLYGRRRPEVASAPERASGPREAGSMDVSLELGLGGSGYQPISSVDVSIFGVASTLRARFQVSEHWAVQGAWSFPYASMSVEGPVGGDSDSKITAGNPLLGAWYLLPLRDRLLRLGIGLAIPLANASSTIARVALDTAAAMHGFFDGWLWANETLSLVMGLDYEGAAGEHLRASARADLAVAAPSGDRSGDTEVLAQWSAGIAHVAGSARIGLRMLAFWAPNQELFQLSLRPFFEYALEAVYLRTAMHLNLDEPLGFSFDERGYWGLLLSVGYRG